jgi:hypothetical protein
MYLTGDMYWDQDKNEHYIHGKRKYVHVNPKVFSTTIIDDGADAPAGNNTATNTPTPRARATSAGAGTRARTPVRSSTRPTPPAPALAPTSAPRTRDDVPAAPAAAVRPAPLARPRVSVPRARPACVRRRRCPRLRQLPAPRARLGLCPGRRAHGRRAVLAVRQQRDAVVPCV